MQLAALRVLSSSIFILGIVVGVADSASSILAAYSVSACRLSMACSLVSE